MTAKISKVYLSIAYLLITFCCSCCSYAIADSLNDFANVRSENLSDNCSDCAKCSNLDQVFESNAYITAKLFQIEVDHELKTACSDYNYNLSHFAETILPNAPPYSIFLRYFHLHSLTTLLISAQNAPPTNFS